MPLSAHSTDIAARFGTVPDLCVYAGVPAAMFLANADPEADLAVMAAARENLRKIAPKKLVLISSIAVYADSRARMNPMPHPADLPAYGRNRLQLEHWVRQDFPDASSSVCPPCTAWVCGKTFSLTCTPSPRPCSGRKNTRNWRSPVTGQVSYALADNGFYKLVPGADAAALREFFAANDFNALAFTDSRSRYQFYNLGRLWQDIEKALDAGLTLLNLTTPPVTAAAVYTAVTGGSWRNELNKPPFDYDLRSRHAQLLGGKDGYLCTEAEELADICAFMKNWN